MLFFMLSISGPDSKYCFSGCLQATKQITVTKNSIFVMIKYFEFWNRFFDNTELHQTYPIFFIIRKEKLSIILEELRNDYLQLSRSKRFFENRGKGRSDFFSQANEHYLVDILQSMNPHVGP
jgi:hypothetical protein